MEFNWFKKWEARVLGCYVNGAGSRFQPNHLFQNFNFHKDDIGVTSLYRVLNYRAINKWVGFQNLKFGWWEMFFGT